MKKEDIIQKLQAVKSLEFTIKSKPEFGTEYAEGKGLVNIYRHSDSLIVFEEKGIFKISEEIQSPFINRMYWEFKAEEKGFYHGHMREGEDAPVELVHLLASTSNTFESEEVHLCGADIYEANISFQKDCITANWKVKGPHKDYQKLIQYYF